MDAERLSIHHALQDTYAQIAGVTWCQPGLGDFLNGSIFLWHFCRQHTGFSVSICFQAHPTLKHLLAGDPACAGHHGEIALIQYGGDVSPGTVAEFLLQQQAASRTGTLGLCTNMLEDACPAECRAFLHAALTPKPLLQTAVDDALRAWPRGSFDVLHVRCDDNDREPGLSGDRRVKLDAWIATLPARRPFFVMSNNQSLREDLAQTHHFMCRHSKVNHLGVADEQHTTDALAGALDTMVDFFVMGHAAKIWQASVYPWGSNFSLDASRVFGIPLERFAL